MPPWVNCAWSVETRRLQPIANGLGSITPRPVAAMDPGSAAMNDCACSMRSDFGRPWFGERLEILTAGRG